MTQPSNDETRAFPPAASYYQPQQPPSHYAASANPVSPMPPVYPQQPYYPPVAYEPKNGLGITALVCGIVGLLFCIIPITGPFVGGPLSILAIVFGAVGRGRVKRRTATNGKVAAWGLALGIVCFVAATGDAIYVSVLANHVSDCLDATSNALNNLNDQGAQDAATQACQS